MNAALVASQWQHGTWSFHCTDTSWRTRQEAAFAVSQVFGVTRPGFEPIIQASVARALLVHFAGASKQRSEKKALTRCRR